MIDEKINNFSGTEIYIEHNILIETEIWSYGIPYRMEIISVDKSNGLKKTQERFPIRLHTGRSVSRDCRKLTDDDDGGPPIAPSTECGETGSEAPLPDSVSSSFIDMNGGVENLNN
ncbi:hypothetical protein KUTeg_000774 [Tegillarca granosa]|uniref:Uncharacterized protein n=1 Tax=Tegillarca granosa TaxID=220873 RepID=A0ABQ9G2U4_TEGGR|nr:hypothetical protein KUTeg_000774 [Tegillarca granosa]